MKTIGIFIVTSIIFLAACSEEISNPDGTPDDGQNNGNPTEWIIPSEEVKDGGPGRDGIPAISVPEFKNADEINYLNDNDLVLGFVDGDDIRAYPHAILNWHEIINDDTKNHSIAVIYCPLTGTGIGWDRVIDNKETTFGVSGLLYNSNIIPYDRETNSNWSQLLNKSVNGHLIGKQAKTYNLIETTWKTWRQMYPSTKVVTTETGYNRNYQYYPYGGYKTSSNLIFPVNNTDPRLQPKERVLGVIFDGSAKVFTFDSSFMGNKVSEESFKGEKLVIVSNSDANFMVAYYRTLPDGTILNFDAVQDNLPIVLIDNDGTTWDISGLGVSGPRAGEQLKAIPQMMGYWFSFPAFYPDLELN